MYEKHHTAKAKALMSKAQKKGKEGLIGLDNPSAKTIRCIETG